ncbi:MAG: PASTA domain-containing protein [Microthrixaceae bacterium]
MTDESHDDEGAGTPRIVLGWARGTTVVVLALALTVFVMWLFGWSDNLDPLGAVLGRPAQVEVPDLAGLAQPRAEADLDSAKLRADVEFAPSLTSPRGAVVSQDPEAGTKVDIDSSVTVVVSEGIARVEMPEAIGVPLEGVADSLEVAGVDFEIRPEASETVPDGVVIDQYPDPGQRVTPADEVYFVVSTGPDPRAVLDVTGLSSQGAAFALGAAGFEVGADLRDDNSVMVGAVIGTDPAAMTVLPRDSLVTIVVSAGPPPVALPDLKGLSQDAAVAQLTSLGLVANLSGGGATGGAVASQVPEPGTELRAGDLVEVVLSGG